jgi:hypothetical protein
MQNKSSNNPENEVVSEEKEETETLDFSQPEFTFVPNGVHEWRQQGYYLECRGCSITHTSYIGPDHILTGFDPQNNPILKTRKELSMA